MKIKEYEKYVVNMTQNAENDLNEIIMFIAHNNPRVILGSPGFIFCNPSRKGGL